jgi:thiol-disulfide isomerase/thioredoxin
MKFAPLLLAIMFIVCSKVANGASNATFNQAVQDYNDGHYAHALSEFEVLKVSYPNNALVHYYDGLCLQATGRLDKAKTEFSFVMTCPDQKLRLLGQKGLAQLSGAHSGPQTGLATAYNSTTTTTSKSAHSSGSGKVKRVLEFWAEWCGPCKAFAPVFEEVKAQMHDVQFDRYDIDTAEGKELSAKYPFPTIPHSVFLDAGGNVLFSGSPQREVDSFTQQIQAFK